MDKPKLWLVTMHRTVHVTEVAHVLVHADNADSASALIEARSDDYDIDWRIDPESLAEAGDDIDYGIAEEVLIGDVIPGYPDAVRDLVDRLIVAAAEKAPPPESRPALTLSADEDSRYRHHLTGLSAIKLLNELQGQQARGFDGLAYVDLARQEYARRGAPLPGGK